MFTAPKAKRVQSGQHVTRVLHVAIQLSYKRCCNLVQVRRRSVGHCHVETIGRPRVHETKQTLNEVERFFYNLAEFVSDDQLRRLSENFSVFCKVSSPIAFCNMIAPLPKSQTRHPAPAHAPLSSFVSSGFLCKVG